MATGARYPAISQIQLAEMENSRKGVVGHIAGGIRLTAGKTAKVHDLGRWFGF